MKIKSGFKAFGASDGMSNCFVVYFENDQMKDFSLNSSLE